MTTGESRDQPGLPRSPKPGRRARVRRALTDALFIQDPGIVTWILRSVARVVLLLVDGSRRRSQVWGRRVWNGLPPRTGPELPKELAVIGPCARAALGVSKGVHQRLDRSNIGVVVADSPAEAQRVVQPTVVLSAHPNLAVPAFDPRMHNPIGWRRRVEDRVAALGPIDQLPDGIDAQYVLDRKNLHLIRHCHHVEDVGSYHANLTERAGTLVRLAATGTPIHLADSDPRLEPMLGKELFHRLAAGIGDADATTRELHSIRMRRLALKGHTIDHRFRQICGLVLKDPTPVPGVSIILATNRPDFLGWALDNVARQNYPTLELVLALHGDHFDRVAVEQAISPLSCPVEVVRFGREHPFPVVLNAATAAANGELVTKMDDDDLYDEHHVWDLVLAHDYSGAHLVGKGAEIVYLQRRDQTIERYRNHAETYSRNVAGGTLLIARDHVDAIGGWQGVPPKVDWTLINDVIRAGGLVYRTHGTGYVLIRHGERHSWNARDDYFLEGATAIHNGWRPDIADIEAPSPPLRNRPASLCDVMDGGTSSAGP